MQAHATRRLVLASELASVARASEWLRGLGAEAGLGEEDLYRLDLCASELVTNIVSYAYEEASGHAIELHARTRPGEVLLEIADDGREFDLSEYEPRPHATSLRDVVPGGWGLRLIRRFADECRYERSAGRNLNVLYVRHRALSAPELSHARSLRGTDRRRATGPVVFPVTRADGTLVLVEARSGGDRRLLGLVSRFEIFDGIPVEVVERAVARGRIVRYPDGTVLLRPGERNTTVAFVLSGRLRVHHDAPGSQNFFVIEVGNCAGEMSAIDGKPVSAYVVADSGCRALLVEGDTLFAALLSAPEAARRFMAVLTERLRRTSERMLEQQRQRMEFEQLQRDLRVAHDIQLGMLPHEASFLSDRPEVEIAAGIRVARQVGGDFYDAYFVDRSHAFLMIGDVCGKGLPAALFMVRAMTLLRSESSRRHGARKQPLQFLMDRVNALLLERNDASLFATVFCGLLDTTTGRLAYVNAGHCPPLLAGPGRPFAPLAEPRNPVVGIIDGISYVGGEIALEPGATLVLYTDGVTEAQSRDDGDFGAARLLAALDSTERRASSLLEATLCAVSDFAGAEPQSDDIAVLVARFLGPPERRLRAGAERGTISAQEAPI